MAFDRQSARRYFGREIPNWQELGLDADRVYRLYRDPEELAKGASTFNNLPILNKHIRVTAEEPKQENVVGSIGSDVSFSAPFLQASLSFWVASAIAGIESEQQCELSPAYYYRADMTPGVSPDGEAFDGSMRDIAGNHLAVIETGRTGPDVYVADSNPFVKNTNKPKETPAMKMTKLGKALFVSLRGLSPKIAQDSMDSEIDAEKADEIIDAVIGVEESPEAVELDRELGQDEPDLMGFLAGKLSPEDLEAVKGMMSPAKDAEPGMNPEAVEEKVTAAMDSMRVEFRQLEQAKVDVRAVVGDVIGMDSADPPGAPNCRGFRRHCAAIQSWPLRSGIRSLQNGFSNYRKPPAGSCSRW